MLISSSSVVVFLRVVRAIVDHSGRIGGVVGMCIALLSLLTTSSVTPPPHTTPCLPILPVVVCFIVLVITLLQFGVIDVFRCPFLSSIFFRFAVRPWARF